MILIVSFVYVLILYIIQYIYVILGFYLSKNHKN